MAQTEYFVATNGNDAADGTNWVTALRTISNGVAKATAAGAGSIVTVSNGTYNISTQINVSVTMTIRSFGNGVTGGLANASNTVVQGSGSMRVFYITGGSPTIQGLTITGGNVTTGIGGGVWMNGGLVHDCIVRNNSVGNQQYAGGIYMSDGTVSNCVIRSNYGGAGAGYAGGIYASAGTVVFCQIYENGADVGSGGGGGVYLNGASVVVRNCLIRNNTANFGAAGSGGGGVMLLSGTVESCTIAANSTTASAGGGGIYRGSGTAGTIRNCVVYGNTASANPTYQNTYSTVTNGVTYTCTASPVVAGPGCISGDPLFVNSAEGNCRLNTGSPAIDAGDNTVATWAADLDGNTRIQAITGVTARVDMGAYEYNAALHCDFLASPRYVLAAPTTYQCFGPAPLDVTFTASAGGTNLTGLGYLWDFDGDGIYDQTNATPTASHTYTIPGF